MRGRSAVGSGRALNVRRPEPAPAAAPAAPPPPPDSVQALTTELEQLQRLRDQGTLTDEEFEAEKAKLLARG
jgi:Short C-terminal domain